MCVRTLAVALLHAEQCVRCIENTVVCDVGWKRGRSCKKWVLERRQESGDGGDTGGEECGDRNQGVRWGSLQP